jgi:hypothetical protein
VAGWIRLMLETWRTQTAFPQSPSRLSPAQGFAKGVLSRMQITIRSLAAQKLLDHPRILQSCIKKTFTCYSINLTMKPATTRDSQNDRELKTS